jgi:hypothetical protein
LLAVPEAVVSYQLVDSSVVKFEIDRPSGFYPAGGPDKVAGKVRDAIVPAVEAAKEVLGKAKEAAPDEVEMTFGVKVSGHADWVIARAASEANFEIRLTWRPARSAADALVTADAPVTAGALAAAEDNGTVAAGPVASEAVGGPA